jgi:hypothetical protein
MRNKPPGIRAVTAKSALRQTVVMYALRIRGHSTRPAPASWDEEPKQIAELQSRHARQRGNRAPGKVCAVNHAACSGQRKEKESYRRQRVYRVVIRQERTRNPRKYYEDHYYDSERHIRTILKWTPVLGPAVKV